MTRCPFSLPRLVNITRTGQVIYKAEKDACRAFLDPQRDELAGGPKRNFRILDPPGIPGGVHPAHSIEGGARDSLLRLVLEHHNVEADLLQQCHQQGRKKDLDQDRDTAMCVQGTGHIPGGHAG